MTPFKDRACKYIAINIIILMFGYILFSFQTQGPSGDELIFIRVTNNLPHYYSHMEWWTLDGKTDPNTFADPPSSTFFTDIFEVDCWNQPPLASYLSYPLVKLVYNDSTTDTILESVRFLRIMAWLLLALSIIGMVYLVRKETNSGLALLFSTFPLLASIPFFWKWTGQNWWYYDAFMWSFLIAALILRRSKYSCYIYIPLTLMVASKMYAIIFLIPFAIENRKTLWCAFAIVPFFIYSSLLTGDWLYLLKNWASIGGNDSFIIARFREFANAVSHVYLLLITVLPSFVYLLFKGIKKHAFILILFVTSAIVGLFWQYYYYHQIPMMLIGIWMVAISMTTPSHATSSQPLINSQIQDTNS